MSGKKVTDCPYAVALIHHGDGDASVQSETESVDDFSPLQNCPAFVDAKGCPFKGVSSPDQVKETLLQIPPSHYEMSNFMKLLQSLHMSAAWNTTTNKEFQLPGGRCPVPDKIKSTITAAGGFRQVLEDMSLAAIMARMAEDFERESERASTKDDEVSAPLMSSSAVSVSNNDDKRDTPQGSHRLSASLKSGTALSHQEAENVHFVKNFIQGKIDRGLYSKMVVSLFHVYVALEQALEAHAPTEFPQCHFPKQLNRTLALTEDVRFWCGFETIPPPSPATSDYVARIQHLAATEPLLLLAHSYTRYLGDLSGGKILARVARRALQLQKVGSGSAVEGLAFYHFQDIPSAKVFKDMYRKALDDLPLTSNKIQRLVQEANVAFLLNMRLFEELDVQAKIPDAVVRPLEDVLKVGPDYSSENLVSEQEHDLQHNNLNSHNGNSEDKCPFLTERNKTAAQSVAHKGGRCPWPFIAFHDPKQFAQQWQTWVLVGVLLCWMWSYVTST